MIANQEDVGNFISGLQKLSRRSKARFTAQIEAVRAANLIDLGVLLSPERLKQWRELGQPRSAAWHAIWCIVCEHTLYIRENITAEVISEANKMLADALEAQRVLQNKHKSQLQEVK